MHKSSRASKVMQAQAQLHKSTDGFLGGAMAFNSRMAGQVATLMFLRRRTRETSALTRSGLSGDSRSPAGAPAPFLPTWRYRGAQLRSTFSPSISHDPRHHPI